MRSETYETKPFAGKLAEPSMLVNVPRLVTAYYTEIPDPSVPEQRVAFGTSGIVDPHSIRRSMNGISSPSAKLLSVPSTTKHQRSVVSRYGHACALRAGSCQRA